MFKKPIITFAILMGCSMLALLVLWGGFRLLIYVNGTKEPDVKSPDGKLTAFVRMFGFMDQAYSYIYVGKPGERASIVLPMYAGAGGNVKWSPDSSAVAAISIPSRLSHSTLYLYVYSVRTRHGYSGDNKPVKLAVKMDWQCPIEWKWKDPHTIIVEQSHDDGSEWRVVASYSFSVTDTGKRLVVRRL